MARYHYRSFPSGNSHEWPEIIEHLRSVGVRLERSRYPSGGCIFRWPAEDTPLFPSGEVEIDTGRYVTENYFGTPDSGHSIFRYEDEFAEEWRFEMRGGPWEEC